MKKKNVSKPEIKGETSKKSLAERVSSAKSGKDFIVVGLGASAGGIRALQEFFATMPPNSGMAFVVILHLSPEHESNLAQIIQSHTTMPVNLVTKANKVEPNNVYVIPPNRQLEMVDGIVRCKKPVDGRGKRVAIDTFFRTLAEVYERNAVCVVLSGTGTDGTLGLKRIKESNGFAVVQDPNDAEYEQMPRSAIATQLADWILPVEQMPEKLIEFRESSERMHLTDDDDGKVAKEIQADESLREILILLRVRTGHDFSNYKKPTLIRRIARHLQIHSLEDIPAYLEFLRKKPEEINSLLKNLLINVTNFFRDREAWESLERDVVPHLFAGKKASDTVRVWSAGCASGEEAYSLAIILNEYAFKLADPPKIQVFATDVDEDAVSEAREHRYPQAIEADVSMERLRRYFVKEGSYYRVKKEIRETVLFAPHNVLRDPPFSKLDLIVCRNLLIYLNRDTQDRLMQIFHFALAARGYLFLGSSETAEGVPELFAPLDKKRRIYSRRPAPVTHTAPPRMPVFGRWNVSVPESKIKSERERAFSLGEIHYKLLEKFAPPSILVNSDFEIQYMSDTAGRFLKFRGGALQNNLLKLINPDLLPDLRAALFNAQRERTISEFKNLRCRIDGEETIVNIIVRPVEVEDETLNLLLVIFDEENRYIVEREKEQKPKRVLAKDDAVEAVVRRLEEELARTKENLRTTVEQHEISIEELKASNEELQAINEELRSATEELETGKEELQSVNEELTTVNHELKEKIEETSRTNSDLRNLISSTDIATIFLDRDLRIKRITPPVEKFFNISAADVGRPLAHFTHKLNYDNLSEDAATVLRSLHPLEREVADKSDRFYIARFLPYRTIEDKIDGVVLNFIDITERKRAEIALRQSEERMQRVLDTKAVGVIFFDYSGTIINVNEAFLEMTGYTRADVESGELTWRRMTPPEWIAESEAQMEICEKTGRIGPYEKEYFLKDGSRRWMLFAGRDLGDGTISEYCIDTTDRKRAEEQLRESETRLRLVLESAKGFAIFTTDANGLIDSWNAGAAEIFGWSEQEILGQSAAILFKPEDRAAGAPEKELKTAATEGVAPDNRWHVLKDGTLVYINGAVHPLFDAAGHLSGFTKIGRDLTAQYQVEEALRESEKRLQTLLKHLPGAAVFIVDRDLRYQAAEGEALTKAGFAPEDFIGRTIFEALPEETAAAYEPMYRRALAGEAFEHEHESHDRWFISRGAPLKNQKGEIYAVLVTSYDITERKQAEERVRLSEERFRLIVESATEYAIITIDEDSLITSWNVGAERLFGYREKEVLGKSDALLFLPEDREREVYLKEIENAKKKGIGEDDRWLVRKDGSRFYASGAVMPMRDGSKYGFIKIVRDQTEKIKAEAAINEKATLEKLVKMQEEERRRIARDVHDQLGQQITALRLGLDAIKKTRDKGLLREKIDEIQKTAEQLDEDIDFLAWELRPAALDDLGLRATLANFVKEWSRYSGVKAEFHTSGLKKTRLSFEAETNLYRIAQEALNNVFKHAKAKNISVLLEKRKDFIVLIIEDDGVGFNVEKKLKEKKGLGLVGMDERAKLLGGSLEIESSKGKGTTVFARIPIGDK